MISRDAIEKIEEMSAPKVVEVEGKSYSKNKLTLVRFDGSPQPDVLNIYTLTGLIEYVKAKLDKAKCYTLHVSSQNTVTLYGEYEAEFGRRKRYVHTVIGETGFNFGHYYDQENFIINLQSEFVDGGDRDEVLKQVSNVKDESKLQQNDDGISQQVTVKAGVGTLEDVTLKNPVKLAPYRSFPEIDQVESQYVLRMQKRGDTIAFALFEVDGKRWELEAVHRIRDYLKKELNDEGIIIIA